MLALLKEWALSNRPNNQQSSNTALAASLSLLQPIEILTQFARNLAVTHLDLLDLFGLSVCPVAPSLLRTQRLKPQSNHSAQLLAQYNLEESSKPRLERKKGKFLFFLASFTRNFTLNEVQSQLQNLRGLSLCLDLSPQTAKQELQGRMKAITLSA